VGWLQLAGGVGDYVIRVFARHRREVNRLYNELFERGVDPLSDEFQQARKNLEGREQYLLQLWREP
jgi:rubrerythrin